MTSSLTIETLIRSTIYIASRDSSQKGSSGRWGHQRQRLEPGEWVLLDDRGTSSGTRSARSHLPHTRPAPRVRLAHSWTGVAGRVSTAGNGEEWFQHQLRSPAYLRSRASEYSDLPHKPPSTRIQCRYARSYAMACSCRTAMRIADP
jgi:hypothetical protein